MVDLETIHQGMSIKRTLKFIFYGILIFAILAEPIKVLMTTHDPAQGLYEFGKTVFLSTEKLANESKLVLEEGGAINTSLGFFKSVIALIIKYMNLFAALGLTMLWIKGFTYPFTRNSPTVSNKIGGYFLGLCIFYVVQVIFLLGYAGMNHTIEGITGDNSVTYFMLLPITSLILFIKVIPLLISPISNLSDKVLELGNQNISSNLTTAI